jgi:hypothetical protein
MARGFKKTKRLRLLFVFLFLWLDIATRSGRSGGYSLDKETAARIGTFGEKQQPNDGIGQIATAMDVVMDGAPASDILRGTDMLPGTATKPYSTSSATGLHRARECVCDLGGG